MGEGAGGEGQMRRQAEGSGKSLQRAEATMRLIQLIRKEFIQFRRDILLAFFIFLIPVSEFLLMARTTGREISHLKVAVLDWDNTPASRRFVDILHQTRRLDVDFFSVDERHMRRLLDGGQVTLGVIIPSGFGDALYSKHGEPRIYALVDGSNSVPASLALSGLYAALDAFTREKLREQGWKPYDKVRVEPKIFFNPTYDMRHFTLPAMVGFIVYQVTLAIASLGLARERELGTLEQLIVSPLPRIELVIGKAIPPLVIGLTNFLFLLAVAVRVYGVPMRGSFILLIGVTALFLLSEVGWGIMLSTFSQTQQQAILFVFIQVMVDTAFSGFIVPVKNMPGYLRFIAHFVPLQHYLAVIRQIMLKGAVLGDIWQRVAMLAVLGSVMFVAAAINTSRRLD